MNEAPRPLLNGLLIAVLPFLRGRASLQDAALYVFVPALVIDRALTMFAQPEGHAALTFFLLGTHGLLACAATILWRCSKNTRGKKSFYLTRIVSGSFIAFNLGVFLLVFLTNGVSL